MSDRTLGPIVRASLAWLALISFSVPLLPQTPPDPLTLRRTKGAALTLDEADDNLENLFHLLTGADSASVATPQPFALFGPAESGGLTATDCDAAAEANKLRIDLDVLPSGDWMCVCRGAAGWACTGGSSVGEWTDTGTTLHPTETTDEVVVGATVPVSSAKFSIDGDADQIQSLVQGFSTQTNPLFVVESSAGADFFKVNTVAAGVNGFAVTPAATTDTPVIATEGTDANIPMALMPKGNEGVGIGTTDPLYKLHVLGDVMIGDSTTSLAGDNQLIFSNLVNPTMAFRHIGTGSAANFPMVIDAYTLDDGGADTRVTQFATDVTTQHVTQPGAQFYFSTTPAGGSLTQRLFIGDSGNVTLSTATGSLVLPLQNDAATPTLCFGDCDTGLYESADDVLEVGAGAASRLSISTTNVTLKDDVLIARDTNAGLTASTTQTQGQGALTGEYNEISTVASPNDTVTLPSASAGLKILIINNGASTLQIFPASGDDLGAGVDTATTLAAGSNLEVAAYNATNWETI